MRNILSYTNRPLLGADIKEWIIENTKQKTEYTNIAYSMLRYLNLRDDGLYQIVLAPSGTGAGERRRYKPNVVRIKD